MMQKILSPRLLPWTLLLLDLCLTVAIVLTTRCTLSFVSALFFCVNILEADTEIDWKAYMQEVEGFLGGEHDYVKLRGDTGPLVYPGGFVLVFSLLHMITDGGVNIFLAQLVFVGLYIGTLAVVFFIYSRASSSLSTSQHPVPYWLIATLCLSKRIHSIFVLRLFNDPVAMLFVYLAIAFAMRDRWTLASVFYSLGLSIKMNVLLFLPGFGLLLVERFGTVGALPNLAVIFLLQVLVGLPFLLENWVSYLSKAFEFSREFFYVWTVNWKMLPEETFLDKRFAVALLVLHLSLLALFYFSKWSRPTGGLLPLLLKHKPNPSVGHGPTFLTSDRIATILFTCNFIGIACARSLHYQFYSWYFHTLPYLLWKTDLPVFVRFVILAVVEYCWNVYPATSLSSSLLQAANLVVIISLYMGESV